MNRLSLHLLAVALAFFGGFGVAGLLRRDETRGRSDERSAQPLSLSQSSQNSIDRLLAVSSVSTHQLFRLYKALASMPGDALKALAQQVASELERGTPLTSAHEAILQVFLETDPEEAFQLALTLAEDGAARHFLLHGLAREKTFLGIEAAGQWLSRIENRDEHFSLTRAVLSFAEVLGFENSMAYVQETGITNFMAPVIDLWARKDGNAAAEYIMTMPKGRLRNDAFDVLSMVWVGADPETALSWATHCDEQPYRSWFFGRLLLSMNSSSKEALDFWKNHHQELVEPWKYFHNMNSPEDPALQDAWLAVLTGESRAAFLNSSIRDIGKTDFGRALSLIEKEGAGLRRKQLINALFQFDFYQPEDEGTAKEWLAALPSESDRHWAMESLLIEWMRYNPEGPLPSLSKLSLSHDDQTLLRRFGGAWLIGRTDDSIIEWMKSIPDQSAAYAAMQKVLQRWTKDDPKKAKAYVLTVDDPSARNRMLQTLGASWPDDDFEALYEWAGRLGAGPQFEVQSAQIRSLVGGGELDEAASRLLELSQGQDAPALLGYKEGRLAGELATQWAANDPQAAGQWASLLPDGSLRDKAVQHVAEVWLDRDPTEASAWIQTMPESSFRDRATVQLVEHLYRHDPERALAWAAVIGDVSEQTKALNTVLAYWHRFDATAAEINLESLGADLRSRYP